MSLFLQHGYGKSNKFELLAPSPAVQLVVLSPTDEDRASLRSTAVAARSLGLATLIDPQTYIYSTDPAGYGRKHASHGLAFERVHWAQDAQVTTAQVQAVHAAQLEINPDGPWIAPTVFQTTLGDNWTPLALQLARTAASAWGASNTIASVVVDEAGFSNSEQLREWLNVATTLDVRGFYILVQRGNTGYPPVRWSPDRLSQLMSMIYTLGELNGYEIYWGFADQEGLLGLAAGATSVGSGWSYGLRQFSTGKWIPSKGGRPAVVRVPARGLWSPIRAVGEAPDLLSRHPELFTALITGRFNESSFGALSNSDAQVLYLQDLADHAHRVMSNPTISARLDLLEGELGESLAAFRRLEAEQTVLEPRYQPRVEALAEALQLFRERESL